MSGIMTDEGGKIINNTQSLSQPQASEKDSMNTGKFHTT